MKEPIRQRCALICRDKHRPNAQASGQPQQGCDRSSPHPIAFDENFPLTTFFGIAAPTVALVIGRLDRKLVNLALCALLIASNIAVALTSEYFVLLAARMPLGIAIGGFFTLAVATVVHLVTLDDIGQGISVVFVGMSAELVDSPTLATLIGEAFAGVWHSWLAPDANWLRSSCRQRACQAQGGRRIGPSPSFWKSCPQHPWRE
ncbi:hypothetical protein [Neotabrizicola sp. sgz301269]|uniref:hypothetical protein n=1 Tax=Neotabrizicola sp. sgz301269 TaxID=3276282 RepID=UPI00376F75BF